MTYSLCVLFSSQLLLRLSFLWCKTWVPPDFFYLCLSRLPSSLFSSQPLYPLCLPTGHHSSVPILPGDRRITSLWSAYIARDYLKTLKEQKKLCNQRFNSLCTIRSISFCATKSLQFSPTLRSQHAVFLISLSKGVLPWSPFYRSFLQKWTCYISLLTTNNVEYVCGISSDWIILPTVSSPSIHSSLRLFYGLLHSIPSLLCVLHNT